MTLAALLATCRAAEILLSADGDRLTFDAPVGAVTAALRDELIARKAELLAVLPRLDGMRRNVGRVPMPIARFEAKGGPGRCFSCGDSLGHPEAYGRCGACDVAAEAMYAEDHDYAERWRPAALPLDGPQRRTA